MSKNLMMKINLEYLSNIGERRRYKRRFRYRRFNSILSILINFFILFSFRWSKTWDDASDIKEIIQGMKDWKSVIDTKDKWIIGRKMWRNSPNFSEPVKRDGGREINCWSLLREEFKVFIKTPEFFPIKKSSLFESSCFWDFRIRDLWSNKNLLEGIWMPELKQNNKIHRRRT